MTILETVKTVSENVDAAAIAQRSIRANEFLAVARAVTAARAYSMNWRTYAEAVKLSPRVSEIMKAGVAPLSTFGPAAELFGPMAIAFVESLRQSSVFDRLWPVAVHVPLHTLAITITTGMIVGSVPEAGVKPLTALSLTPNTITPIKVAGIVAATDELLKLSTQPDAASLFDSALRQAVTVASNTAFLAWLVSQTTPTASSGPTAANAITDLAALLNTITVGENSRLFFVLSGDDAKGLMTKINTAGALQFPRLSVSGGEILPGIQAIISNALPAGTAVMVDAAGLLLADEGITLDSSRNADLQMETAPDSPATANTVTVGLWQRNMLALRAERSFAYAPGRTAFAGSLSGVNY